MAAPISAPWTTEQATSDQITKKQLVEFLQEHASSEFQKRFKLNGKLPSIVKSSSKPHLVEAYTQLFETKEFRNEEEEKKLQEVTKSIEEVNIKEETTATKEEEPKEKEKPRFKKSVLKGGDKVNFPKKGDKVSVRYKGTLDDGTVFDQNVEQVKKKLPPPLSFKVGIGKVIRGWDEGLLTMSTGEKARLVIEPEWAYGKKGVPDAKIPPNATLTFEVELLSID